MKKKLDPIVDRKQMAVVKVLPCKSCGDSIKVRGPVRSVTCAHCVSQMVAGPEKRLTGSNTVKRPRGWHKKARYETEQGEVYEYGVLVNKNDIPVDEGILTGNDGENTVREDSSGSQPITTVPRKRGRPRKVRDVN